MGSPTISAQPSGALCHSLPQRKGGLCKSCPNASYLLPSRRYWLTCSANDERDCYPLPPPNVSDVLSCRGQASTRLRSRPERRIADLPWPDQRVLHARHLRRADMLCRWQILAETVGDVVVPYGCQTRQLSDALHWVGLGSGGESGARLIDRLNMRASAGTILRLVRTQSSPLCTRPRILGMDDWA